MMADVLFLMCFVSGAHIPRKVIILMFMSLLSVQHQAFQDMLTSHPISTCGFQELFGKGSGKGPYQNGAKVFWSGHFTYSSRIHLAIK